MEGIFLIDKPKGITSFDVIRALRKRFGTRRIGHAGTLDPNATGLLLVGVGTSTKKLAGLVGLDKEYEAEILLGVRTDTGDSTGTEIERAVVPERSKDDVVSVLKNLEGWHTFPVPIYSATKQGGMPLYAKARNGMPLVVPLREMHIIRAELVAVEGPRIQVIFTVGSGTYIRSLAEELGRQLGTVATLAELRRTKVGHFRVQDAEQP